jgi:uncharacterized membrane-anchored protein YhcB (DUF1043 family)
MDETWARWLLGGLGAIIVAVFGDMFRRLFAKQDELARDKANRDSTDKRFGEMFDRMDQHMVEDREMHKDVGRKLDETNRHLSTTNVTLATLAGRFEERIRNGDHT